MLCTGNFWFFAKVVFCCFGCPGVSISSLPNTRTLRANTLLRFWKNTAVKKEKQNCFLIMERRRWVREVFIDFPISLNPEKKVFYFRSFSVVNDFFVAAAACTAHNTIVNMNIKGTWKFSLSTHTPSSEWYQFRFSDRLQIGGVLLSLSLLRLCVYFPRRECYKVIKNFSFPSRKTKKMKKIVFNEQGLRVVRVMRFRNLTHACTKSRYVINKVWWNASLTCGAFALKYF